MLIRITVQTQRNTIITRFLWKGCGSEPVNSFRAPVDDTQDLFSDSEMSDIKEEAVNEKLSNPSKEVFAPFVLAMNLTLDYSPLNDDVSSDEEENNKENTVPHLQGSATVTLPPSGDPVRAFVDEEAEEEDDSDNDLQRFRDNKEDEDDYDIEELNDLIAWLGIDFKAETGGLGENRTA